MGYKFGLVDAKIAVWNSESNWATAIDLDGVQMMSVQLDTVNGILEGDDEIKDVHAKIIAATVRVRFAFNSLAVLEVLLGENHVESPSSDTMVIDTDNLPYWGMCGRVDHTDDAGDLHLFIPKCKILESFTLGGQYGQYITPELTCRAVRDGATYGVYRLYEHDTAQAVTLPPT